MNHHFIFILGASVALVVWIDNKYLKAPEIIFVTDLVDKNRAIVEINDPQDGFPWGYADFKFEIFVYNDGEKMTILRS